MMGTPEDVAAEEHFTPLEPDDSVRFMVDTDNGRSYHSRACFLFAGHLKLKPVYLNKYVELPYGEIKNLSNSRGGRYVPHGCVREAFIGRVLGVQAKAWRDNYPLLDLAKRILELADHGDYSNGNEAYGLDEGRVRAGELLEDLHKELDVIQGVRITYRGWPGHFIAARHCIFRLNTLVEVGDIRYVVSTVGNLQVKDKKGNYAIEGLSGAPSPSYYETVVFRAALKQKHYWDPGSGSNIGLVGKRTVDSISVTSDREAQGMHENAVQEVVERIQSGRLKR